jgi:hypothetical protein
MGRNTKTETYTLFLAQGCLLPLGIVELEAARGASLKAGLLAHVLHHNGNNRNEAHNANW